MNERNEKFENFVANLKENRQIKLDKKLRSRTKTKSYNEIEFNFRLNLKLNKYCVNKSKQSKCIHI